MFLLEVAVCCHKVKYQCIPTNVFIFRQAPVFVLLDRTQAPAPQVVQRALFACVAGN